MNDIQDIQLVMFESGVRLRKSSITNACKKALKAIENELPDEARSFEVYCHIIDVCKDVLQEQKVVL